MAYDEVTAKLQKENHELQKSRDMSLAKYRAAKARLEVYMDCLSFARTILVRDGYEAAVAEIDKALKK
jgi:cell fate (sporulation/competence/biofilm development) regulator YlbF (YheA/YmcA/DUF963 family)